MNSNESFHVYYHLGKLIKEYLKHLEQGKDLKRILISNLDEVQCELNDLELRKLLGKE